MARLYSDLGQRTVYVRSGLAKAQGLPCLVYKTPPGHPSPQPANLAAFDPGNRNAPGSQIVGGALIVDSHSNRPAFWDLDDMPCLWITVAGGPVEAIYPDSQPQLDAQQARIVAMEPGGSAQVATVAALAAEGTARNAALNVEAAARLAGDAAAVAAAAQDATAKANAVVEAAAAAAAGLVADAAAVAALSVSGEAVQATRRTAIADRALLGAGGWIIKRRNGDELRLMREIGDGFVADHQLVRATFPVTPGAAAGPSGEPRPMLLNDIGIGVPMVPVPFSAATYTGAGWATIAGYFSGQFPPPTLGFDVAYPTVSTTAGSTTVSITSGALTPSLRYNTRRVIVPGAGAAGADLVTSIGAMAGDGLSFTAGTAASTAVSGVTATIHPGRRSSSTAAAAVSWTAPLGATSVGVVYGVAGNAGFSTVAIDGDLTRATYLPTAQQLVDQGVADAAMLTTNGGSVAPTSRILDCYSSTELFTLWQALASGLDPTLAHTVALTVTGYKRAASVSTRLIIGGFGYGTATTTPMTATALPFIAIRTGKSAPVHELAVDHQPTGTTTHVFVGGHNHGFEYETSGLALTVDGAAVTLTDDQAVPVAGTATLVRRSDLYHTQATATPTFRARTSYRLDRSGLVVNTLLEAVVATTVDSAYFGSFTANHILNRVQVDKDVSAYNLLDYTTYGEGAWIGTGRNTGAVWWQAGGVAVAALIVPTAKAQTGGWSDGSVLAGVRNFPTTSQSSKWYARRTGVMSPGTRWAGEVTYVIGRLPDGTDLYFPVT